MRAPLAVLGLGAGCLLMGGCVEPVGQEVDASAQSTTVGVPGAGCLPWKSGRCRFENGCFATEGVCDHVWGALRTCEGGHWLPVDRCAEPEPEPEPEPEGLGCSPWAQGYCGVSQGCFAPPESCGDVHGGWKWCKDGRWVPVEGCDRESLRTKFTYPVGDKTSWPAGGWDVWQVLSHHWDDQGGNHLAEDVSVSGGEDAVDAPVYSVANGTVVFAKANASSYKNVVLIRHELEDGQEVCSFYAHVHNLKVTAGQFVAGGQQIAQVLDWEDAVTGGSSRNTHLHYVMLSGAYCDFVARTGTEDFSGSGVCGYDKAPVHDLGWMDVDGAPETYTAVEDNCGAWRFEGGLISPSKFIEAHR